MNPYAPIKDYAIIGNCASAALVSRDGSIDWLCWPRFDSDWIFGSLLDAEKGGRFRIRPSESYQTERRYVDGTNVLETTFTTETGIVRLTDLMPVSDGAAADDGFRPAHEVLRGIECLDGEVEMQVHIEPRLDYARRRARIRRRGRLGYFCNYRSHVYAVQSEIPLTLSEDGSRLDGRATFSAGQKRYVSLVYEAGEPAVLSPLGDHAARKIDATIRYWREWLSICSYEGPFESAVRRSALTLKLMTYSRSGAVVAAPTTSLPEKIGGERNWDYRYCWLRDASFTLRALFELGYEQEGVTFFYWLLYAVGGTQPHLNVLYDVHGTTHVGETVLDHLEGYRGSSPVRIGNDARDQLQLDIYGEVASAVHEYVQRGGKLTTGHKRILRRLGRAVCRRWREPDAGIWEIRGRPRHHTYSKVMCWAALDRLLEMDRHGLLEVDRDHFSANRDEIRDAVEAHAYNADLQSYVSIFDGSDVDASLLLLPTYRYVDADDPRMRSTFDLIKKRLAVGPLIRRYGSETDDGLPPGEGAFGICSFWDEAYLAQIGKIDEAKNAFEATFKYANDVGLFSEEIDPNTGEALGNFPQAFTHVGLINAALTIAEAEGRRPKSGQEERLEPSRSEERRSGDVGAASTSS